MVNNSINNELLQGLGRELARLLSTGKSGLNDYRQKRWADVLAQGIPPGAGRSGKVIDWQGLTNQSFELAGAQVGRGAIDCSDHVLPDAANLVLVNGFFSPGLSDRMALPSGVSVKPLENLIVTEAEAIPQRLNATIVVPNNPFVALADTFIQGGIELCVGANTVCPRLIHIVHIAADSSKPVLSAPRIFVVLEKEAQVDLLVSFVSSSDNAVNWTNAVIDIDMAEGSRCQLFDAQYENVKSYHACTTRVRQCHGSEFSSCVVTVGGAVSRNDVVVELGGEGTSTGLHGIYSITDRQQVDERTLVRHLHPEGMSRQLYNGILAKSAQAVFNGKIYVHPTAQGTNAYQLNKNLLLGKDSRAQSKPQLEIFADDVKCSHGVTVGQLNEDEILYLQMRGISRTDAERMLIEGSVEDVLRPVAIESVRQSLVGLLLPTIASALREERL